MATYYVNSKTGKDAQNGTSPRIAWQSIERVNRHRFAPGDTILFCSEQTFTGNLLLENVAGTKAKPVVIASYGRGRATIDAGAGDGVKITACKHIRVEKLNVVGCGRKNGSDGAGINLVRTENVSLTEIEASGFRVAGVHTYADAYSHITHVYAHDNGASGIETVGGYGAPRARNLYIGYCRADNNPGDPKNLTNHSGNGIVVGGVDNAVIEFCEASNNGWDMPRTGNGPVGIWGWDCDRLTIQFCISHDNKSPGTDGGGFDLDGGARNSVMQYNLSYRNAGTGYLLCQYPGGPAMFNNTVRYNISIGDGLKNFKCGIGLYLSDGRFSDCTIYNNTIINPGHAVATMGDIPDVIYRNNIFVAGSEILSGSFAKSRFTNNLYWSEKPGNFFRSEDGDTVYATLAAWAEATGQEKADGKLIGRFSNPKLRMPTATQKLPIDPKVLAKMPFYHPQKGSPAIETGTSISDNPRDLFGRPVPPRPSLGAGEP